MRRPIHSYREEAARAWQRPQAVPFAVDQRAEASRVIRDVLLGGIAFALILAAIVMYLTSGARP